MPALGRAAVAAVITTPQPLVSGIANVLSGGLKEGTLAGVGAGSAVVAGVIAPALGTGMMISDAKDASNQGRLGNHLIEEYSRYSGHLLYGVGLAMICGVIAPALPAATTVTGMTLVGVNMINAAATASIPTIFMAAATSTAIESVVKKTVDCTNALNCAFFRAGDIIPGIYGGSHSSNSSRIRFITISFIGEKMIEVKRITFETKKKLTQKEFKTAIEDFLNLIIKKLKDELPIDQSILDKIKMHEKDEMKKSVKKSKSKSKSKSRKLSESLF